MFCNLYPFFHIQEVFPRLFGTCSTGSYSTPLTSIVLGSSDSDKSIEVEEAEEWMVRRPIGILRESEESIVSGGVEISED